MAGERKGKTYEAIMKVVLDEIVRSRRLPGNVYWNEIPEGLTTEPDFTVGPDKDHPTHIFLITHSNSSKNSDMKFWRNIAELVEAKTRLDPSPLIFSVAFDAAIKDNLKVLARSAFDGELIVGDLTYGTQLQSWVDKNAAKLPKQAAAKAQAIFTALRAGDQELGPLISALSADVETLSGRKNARTEGLWVLEKARSEAKSRSARTTWFKRGIAKLLVLDDPEDILRKAKARAAIPHDPLAEEMGWIAPSIAGTRLVDPDLRFLTTLDSLDLTLEVLKVLRAKKSLIDMIRPMRDAAAFVGVMEYLYSRWADVLRPEWLYEELTLAHSDPCAYVRSVAGIEASYVRPGVVADAVVELLKAGAGSRQGFGLTQLISQLGRQKSDGTKTEQLANELGIAKINWRSANTVSYGFRDWLFGADRKNFNLTDFEVLRIACALASSASQCSAKAIAPGLKDFKHVWLMNHFEVRVVSHRDLDALGIIVMQRLALAGVQFRRVDLFPSLWAEIAAGTGTRINRRSGSTSVIVAKETIIVIKSATPEGRTHKRGELCARASAIRYTWDTTEADIKIRPGVKKLVLVLDGEWEQADLDALARAGWDAIFYPDEMDDLIKAIV